MGLDDLLNRARDALDEKKRGDGAGDGTGRKTPEVLRRPTSGRITEYGTIPPDVMETAVADLEKNPSDPEAEAYLAFLHYAGKRYEIALEHFDRLLLGGYRPANQHFYRGNCLYQLGRKVEAKAAWKQCLASSPSENVARMVHKRMEWVEDI